MRRRPSREEESSNTGHGHRERNPTFRTDSMEQFCVEEGFPGTTFPIRIENRAGGVLDAPHDGIVDPLLLIAQDPQLVMPDTFLVRIVSLLPSKGRVLPVGDGSWWGAEV